MSADPLPAPPLPPLVPSFVARGMAAARAYLAARDPREPELAVVPELVGIPMLLPLRARLGAASRLLLAVPGLSGGPPEILDTTRRWALRARSPEHERRLLAEYEAWRPSFTPPLHRLHDEVAPLVAARWIEDLFFELQGAAGSLLAYVHWRPDGGVRCLNFGPGFGALERAWSERPLVLARLPLARPFRVIWGGSDPADNWHHLSRRQRYALDVEPLDGTAADVCAPCDAVVHSAHDGEDDLLARDHPARDAEPFGNHVVLACGDLLLTFGHLERGSVRVAAGDRLRAGDPLGRLGDSGRSSRRHLHLQATSAAPPHHAVPLRFAGRGAAARELRRGDVVTPDGPAARLSP